jgi:hypothetical protein
MANFLINSPSSESVGSNTSDLFDLQVLQGVSVFGVEGADTITALNTLGAASSTRLNAGKGADTITLSASTMENSFILAGMGKDVLDVQKGLSSTVVRGGAGLDTMNFSGSLASTTVNGNDMADLISAEIADASSAGFLAAGAGKDVLSASFISGANEFTVNGGLGHDSLSLSQDAAGTGILTDFAVAGGGGLDTIGFDALAVGGLSGEFDIGGGDQNDLIQFNGANLSAVGTATIGGGQGADTIQFSAVVDLAAGNINGGAGADSISISAAFADGTINAGLGLDTITLITSVVTGDYQAQEILGDDGADKYNLGTTTIAATGTSITAGATLRYGSFDESNLETTDFASAAFTFSGGAGSGNAGFFTIEQDVATATIANGIGVTNFSGTNGIAGFTSTFAGDLTARVTELDRVLTKGQTISFGANTT